jgi:hypothetical protein
VDSNALTVLKVSIVDSQPFFNCDFFVVKCKMTV